MFLIAVIILMVISVLMAFHSLKKQNKLEVTAEVRKRLRSKRVIYHKDSSDSVEEP